MSYLEIDIGTIRVGCRHRYNFSIISDTLLFVGYLKKMWFIKLILNKYMGLGTFSLL